MKKILINNGDNLRYYCVLSLTGFMKSVKADEYTVAVIGHVIQSKVNGNNS
jgi:hypothetical protein